MNFTCQTCGKVHEGIPSYGADRPAPYWEVPEERRDDDVLLTSDSCVIAGRFFFVRGCIELPIIGAEQVFVWGAWVSLKKENFLVWQALYEVTERSEKGPYFGWLSTSLPTYPETRHLKTMLHLRDNGLRPRIELERTDHPLAMEQADGISFERLQEIVDHVEHGSRVGSGDSDPDAETGLSR